MADTSRLNTINSSRIIQTIRRNEGISRIQIAEKLNMDRSTVTKIVNNLLDDDIVLVRGKKAAREKVGRKPIGLSINNEIGVVLGIELQPLFCRAVIIDLKGSIIAKKRYQYESNEGSILEVVKRCYTEMKEYADKNSKKLIGVGLGVPGAVDPYKGIIIRSYPLNILSSFSIKEQLKDIISEPFLVENDANCCCWGRLAFYEKIRHRNFLVVLGEFRNASVQVMSQAGIGVGLGLVIRERVLHGNDFTAGEFHSLYYKDVNVTQFNLTNEEASQLPQNQNVLIKVIEELSNHVAFLVNTLNFTQIVIAGGLANYTDLVKPVFKKAIDDNWPYSDKLEYEIDFSQLGEDCVCHGAASLFVEKLFSVPIISERPDEPVGMLLFEEILGK